MSRLVLITATHKHFSSNRIGGVMVSVLASSAVDRGTKDYALGICCFFAKHAALRRKNKDWLARNQNNVSEWSDMSISTKWNSSSLKINLFSP